MSEESDTVLIVEDDADLAEALRHWLEGEGMRARVAASSVQGLAYALDAERPPALVLLDRMLPGMSGLELCRRLRREPPTRRTPIIMLTALSSEAEIAEGLDAGADDYVTKPFSMRELVARARAVMRRAGLSFGRQAYEDSRLTVDYAAMLATLDGRRVRLTRLEFEILAEMTRSAGKVLTRERLMERLWGYDHGGDTNTLTVHVTRLRRKLGDTGRCIETVVGVGYCFKGFAAGGNDVVRIKAAGA